MKIKNLTIKKEVMQNLSKPRYNPFQTGHGYYKEKKEDISSLITEGIEDYEYQKKLKR